MSQPTLVRHYTPTELARPNTGTLVGRAVPYNVATDVVDKLADGRLDAYREGFRPGVFDGAAKEPGRIILIDGHAEHGRGRKLGIATALRSTPDALEVEFRVLPTLVDDVAMLVELGVRDLSVGFQPLSGGTSIDDDGIRWRTRAHLIHVSLEPEGSYPGAEVLAMRAQQDQEEEEAKRLAFLAETDAFLAEATAKQAEWKQRLSGDGESS